MRIRSMRRRLVALGVATAALALSPQVDALSALPERWVLRSGSVSALPVSAAVRASITQSDAVSLRTMDGGVSLAAGEAGEAELSFRLLGLLPIRTVQVSVEPERRLIPGGQSVGVALNTEGVVVVGNSDIGGIASPARQAGLKSGDVIQQVNGAPVRAAEELSACLSSGLPVRLDLLRDGQHVACEITPALDSRDGRYKLGAWVRSSTAGVGTLTWQDPETGRFGALGHAITDVDTGIVMPVGEGALYENEVVMITPGRKGSPGELTGDFIADAVETGTVERNTEFGIFGTLAVSGAGESTTDGLPVATRDEVHVGAATLLTTIDGDGVREYACTVEKVADRDASSAHALVLRITDPVLLSRTGGIVQGMSGSPILQDGRLIGAVTHVMVNDPAMGYGVLIEDMLAASEAA